MQNFNSFLTIISLTLISSLTANRPLILTKYLKQNRTSEAKALSEVKGLPNAPNIKSYSGFLTVDERYNSNLFYWFFPSLKNSAKAPIIIWLEGGPGSSSIWSLFTLNGPLIVDSKLNVTINPYSWSQEFSMIYIDNPVGTGYSFTESEHGYSTDENQIADNLYNFLQQFYEIYSEYRANELYISGESYAGKYIPALGYKLMQMSNQSKINLKGIAIGDGLIDPIHQLDGFGYLKSTGLIDEKDQDDLKAIENNIRNYYRNGDNGKASENFQKLYLTRSINKLSYASNKTGYLTFYRFTYSNYSEYLFGEPPFMKYLELNQTRQALHVGNVKYWVGNETVFQKLSTDIILSMEKNFTALIPNYKVMLFVGNLDMIAGPSQINAMLENRDWKYYKEFYSSKRVIWKVADNDTEVAGYSKGFDKFQLVVVRNAGHSVGIDQPRSALDLIKRFIYNIPFGN